jgi:hypothetical protein
VLSVEFVAERLTWIETCFRCYEPDVPLEFPDPKLASSLAAVESVSHLEYAFVRLTIAHLQGDSMKNNHRCMD